MRTTFSTLIFCILSLYAYAQLPDITKIDRIFSAWNNNNTPGGAVGIIKDGQLIFSKGYGLADLEHNVAVTPSSVFYIASTGKQFTAFCILLLEEQGKLSLSDEVQKFLPDFPKYQAPITISHLIHHTSGLKDYATLWDMQGKDYLDYMPKDEVYDLIKAQSSLGFKPGDDYSYSNSCYLLLGLTNPQTVVD